MFKEIEICDKKHLTDMKRNMNVIKNDLFLENNSPIKNFNQHYTSMNKNYYRIATSEEK